MKFPFVVPFWWFAVLFGMRPYPTATMDYTPPAVIPSHLRETIDREQSQFQEMPNPHHHKRLSQHIEGTVGDVKIDIVTNETLSKSTDTQDSNKSGHSTKFVALTNTATGLITALIGAGVTLAVKYGDCKKD